MTTITQCVGEDTDQTTYFGSPDTAGRTPPQPRQNSAASQNHDVQCPCPFCGEFNHCVDQPCLHCNQEDTIATRAAATQRFGSWFVRQPENPTAPGMSFDDLVSLIHQQFVTPRSIVRGPATGQLWRLAGTIRGLGREFGQCYSCGGDIETDETICPHCERMQTVQQFAEQKPKPPTPAFTPPAPEPEPVFIPETAGPVREALLGEPTIRIRSMSHPDEATGSDEEIFTPRPVIAERSERHVPKDDLLTPRDLAKAFQLEFGMKQDTDYTEQPYRIPGQTARQIKIVFAGTAALAVAFALGMQAIHMLNGTPQRSHTRVALTPPPAPAITAIPATSDAFTDARTASEIAFAKPQPIDRTPAPFIAPPLPARPAPVIPDTKTTVTPVTPTPAAKPEVTKPAPPPHPAAIVTPVMMVEPTPVVTTEDDPTALLNAGLLAESNGNYTAAIRDYERIQSLPSSQWPTHLDTRLQLARRELKGDLH